MKRMTFLLGCLLAAAGPGFAQESAAPPPACLGREPRPEVVVQAAIEEAGLSKRLDQSRQFRLRISAWLPKVTGGVSKDLFGRWDYRVEPGEAPVDQYHLNNGWRWDVGLSWDLSGLLFQREELSVTRETSRRNLEKWELAAMVTRIYFDRFRLLWPGLPKAGSPESFALLEATARLDAWTAGRYHHLWCVVAP